ncbi:MAG: SLBB domain-containing protein [Prevotellaceae bacterium]|jgi:protein involved in polysaccharide export with SLBB domain|nr:SLBB domain-containing protein [Prevotellaceae bacterium]
MHTKKIVLGLLLSIFFTGALNAQMSDQQVIDYVTKANAKGATKEEIATYLVGRGVTQNQLERIKQQHESGQSSLSDASKSSAAIHRDRVNPEMPVNSGDMDELSAEMTPTSNNAMQIFGHEIFNSKNLTFSPSTNIPTPAEYRLGPGDEVIIDVWGASQTSVKQEISPEGNIMVDRLGPLYLNGMTVKDANDFIQKKFASIYSAIDGSYSEIKLTLGRIRTIQINIMGEALSPGTYSLSSLSSVFHALYIAGGVKPEGSLRNIRLSRNGKIIHTLDVYKYIFEGKIDNIRLSDNDVVSVPPYSALVNVSGYVKKPMYYELTENETISDLIRYAGGFTGDAYTGNVRVTRISGGGRNQIFTVRENEYSTFKLTDRDVITISNGIDLYENRVEIRGAVYRSGYYQTGQNINTVKDLIEAADGLRGDAFMNRAVLTREKEDFSAEILSIDVEKIMSGAENVVLRKNDVLYIPSISELQEYGDLMIFGAVARPNSYKYADNTSLEDLIIQAGGLLESASSVKVDISRRIINQKSTAPTSRLSENFTVTIKDGYVIDSPDDKGFILKPYDHVYVRQSPGYKEQKNVKIEGEVMFPGEYSLNKKTERLSDIIKRASGLTPDAYPKGARLIRKRSDEEAFRAKTALKMAQQGGKDSIALNSIDLSPEYSVGIELDKAVTRPGTDYDLVLREGDRLIIPEYESTIKIEGAVMYPNTVIYQKGKTLSHYIDQAGGYADNAKKSKVFVIYMNGTVSKAKKTDSDVIQPGCEIIVPVKDRTRRRSAQEIIGIGASLSPIVSMISVIALMLKK